jgi:hypothetical protein
MCWIISSRGCGSSRGLGVAGEHARRLGKESNMSRAVIDYATPPPRSWRSRKLTAMTFALALLSGALIYVFCFMVPKFDQIFRDFNISLPPLTQAVLCLSRLCSNDFGWVVVLCLPVIPMASELGARDQGWSGASRLTRSLFLLLLAMEILAITLVFVAVFLPVPPIGGGVSSPQSAPPATLTPNPPAGRAG